MKAIKIMLIVLFLCVSSIAIPQANTIAKSLGKTSAKAVTTKTTKEATKAIAKHEAKSIALTATEKSILSRSVRREAQRELAKKSSQVGAKSIMEYTNISIRQQFHHTNTSSTLIKRLSNQDRLSQYSQGIKQVKNHSAQKGISHETRKILLTRLSKYDKVITSNTTSLKEKQKALLSINKELTSLPEDEAKKLRKCLSPKTQKALSGVKIPRTNGVWENPEKAGNCKWIPDKNFRPKPKTMCNGAVYNNPNNLSWEEILKPYGTDGIRYVNCIPDLSPFSYASVQLDYAKILRGKEHLPNHKIREIIQEEAYKQMQKDKQLIAKIKKEGFASVKEYKEAKNLVCHELPDGRVLLVDRQIHDNIPSHLGGVATSKTLLMKTETKSIANKEIEVFTIAMTKELKGKNASTIKQILASSKGGRHAIEENVNNLVLRDEQLIGKYAQRYNMESARQAKLLSEMQNDKDLALLIRSNPEYNILRWNNTLKKVDRTALSKYARNTQYAGKPFYFHPSLNRNIQNYLAQKGTFKGYTREMLLELDKLFPNGVPYTKEGFPDFIKANVCKLDNHGEVIKVLMPSGHFSISREQDFAVARMVARKKYGSINEFGYIWHHLEGEPAAMVLVKTECHEICSHTGGHALERMHIENAARRLTNPINLSATVKIPYKVAN